MTSLRAISTIGIDVTIKWSVCQVTFMHYAQMTEDIDTISFAYDSVTSLPDRVKIWLTLVDPFLSKFCAKVTHLHIYLSVGDIRQQTVAE